MTYWTGAQLKQGLLRMLRDEALCGEHTEFYQLSDGLEIEYDQKNHSFLKFNFKGEPVDDNKVYSVGLQQFHYTNVKDSFGFEVADLDNNRQSRQICTSCAGVIEEVLQKGLHQDAYGTGRLIIHLEDGTVTGV